MVVFLNKELISVIKVVTILLKGTGVVRTGVCPVGINFDEPSVTIPLA